MQSSFAKGLQVENGNLLYPGTLHILLLHKINVILCTVPVLKNSVPHGGHSTYRPHSSLSPSQCQDLPSSLSSSPLTHLDSYAGGRSMDLLLPLPESGRKKSADLDHEAGQRARSERHRTHVGPPALGLLLRDPPETKPIHFI